MDPLEKFRDIKAELVIMGLSAALTIIYAETGHSQ